MKLRKIDKRKARKLFNNHTPIYLLSSNFNETDTNILNFGTVIEKKNDNFIFDNLVNNFSYYNCINSETGKYPHFFIYDN